MQSPIILTFHHIDRSGALEERARKLGHHLTRFNERITHCHMTLQGPDSPGAGAGAAYLVKIDLTVPGAHIHADSLHVDGTGHEAIYLALRDAFNNAKRQLQGLSAVRGRKPDATGLAGAGSG
jgi:putative sigma-54 modulation protein